jgi:hypothetical protein
MRHPEWDGLHLVNALIDGYRSPRCPDGPGILELSVNQEKSGMPVTIQTMISDLYRGRSRGFRGVGFVNAAAFEEQADLHHSLYVQQYATPITLAVGAGPEHYFNMARATRVAANAFYLGFVDGKSTVATLTRAHRIVVGGGYSGCLYSVYHAGAGVYKCVHTARPNNAFMEAYVEGLQLYAQSMRWTLVHAIPTRNDGISGAGIGGCVTTFLATRVSYTVNPNPIVRTVRLRQDAQGNSVHQDRWETPTP